MHITSEKFFGHKRPSYQDINELCHIQQKLSMLPGLVKNDEVDELNRRLEKAFYGQAFIIQAGDCAERFSDAELHITRQKYDQLICLKSLIESTLKLPVITIGRIAGQYAKPRSTPTEMVGGKLAYAYHGDMINAENLTESRIPDPNRMLRGYASSKAVLSHIATFLEQIFTSHECFLLEYEKSLTRLIEGKHYNLSTHLLWLGMRNIESEEHLDYLATIANPVAIKVGAATPLYSVVSAIQQINPDNKRGKVILVTRLGVDKVSSSLPQLIEIIYQNELNVVWMCDPLHGNTQSDRWGKKFRLLGHAADETINTNNILYQNDCYLSGLHLEISPRTDIKECVSLLSELDKNRVYDSALDPRMNHNQCVAYMKQVLSAFV